MAHGHQKGYLRSCEECRAQARAPLQSEERRAKKREANRRWREKNPERERARSARRNARRSRASAAELAGARAARNEKIVAMYRSGKTGPEIAAVVGLSATSVLRVVKQASVPVRPRGTRRQHRAESRGIVQYERGSVAATMTPEELAAFRRWLHEHDLYSRQLARTAAI